MPTNNCPPSAVRAVLLGHVRGLAACSLILGFFALALSERCRLQAPLWPLDAILIGLVGMAAYGVGLIAGADAQQAHQERIEHQEKGM